MTRLGIADALAWLATALAAVAAAAGIAVGSIYRDAPYWVEQARGTDLATLLLAVPLMALGLSLARRGSAVARLAVVGGLMYLVPRRATAAVLVGVAILFGLLWLGQIASATLGGGVPADIVRAGLPTNPVYALDLGLFLPLAVVAGIGLALRAPGASMFALPMLLWLAITSAGILGGFWFTASAGEVVPAPFAAGQKRSGPIGPPPSAEGRSNRDL